MGGLNPAADDGDDEKSGRQWPKYALLAALLMLTACLNWPAGMGGVTGRVKTPNGVPVRGGTVTLRVNGVDYSGGINADGTYTLHDLPLGHALIGLTITEPPPAAPGAAAQAAKGRPRPRVVFSKLPDQTGLTVEVRGTITHDITVPE